MFIIMLVPKPQLAKAGRIITKFGDSENRLWDERIARELARFHG